MRLPPGWGFYDRRGEIMADIKRWHVSAVTASAERSLRAAILARLAGIWLTASRAFLGNPLTRGRGDD
jgi:hypothetical protein